MKLDATKFKPFILPASDFKITVSNPYVRTSSPWIFNLDVATPLEYSCHIKVLLPNDLRYSKENIRVRSTKIFKSARGRSSLLRDEFCDSSDPTTIGCQQYPADKLLTSEDEPR